MAKANTVGNFPQCVNSFIVLCLLVAYTTTSLNVLIETQIDNVEKAAITQVFVLGIGALFNGFIMLLPYWIDSAEFAL